jgi:ORF6N domain
MAKSIMIPDEVIINKIHFITGKKIMLDRDLAGLYDVTTGNLNKAVKRNLKRFPEDFMFQLSEEEFKDLIFQNGISSWGGTRKPPYAFTEQGVAMLSGVLSSEQLEKQVGQNSLDITMIFAALKELLNPPQEPRPRIGFRRKDEEN